ncbi:SAM-dependent methyltransferase [Hanstruepera neustonica]|uniref:SAM-dependent methyltransferase n=1 Tax=Hanstruepera neustonica TaxID=1445657 RepID=A0A2K1DZD7_9FLAO|nr:tRNA (5-methylaminomethyl-2-thiouridine)(34)-methyltransferase MnmD [Hanstruepera neustonica]PNQ73364.1 SAM-dependent methyltransferase [Hanstruepera neustonica]
MKRKIITTADGSKTIQIEDWNEQYHSIHGAYQEAVHVFIKHGLRHVIDHGKISEPVSILEMGFGTGLNAMLTFQEAQKLDASINYVGVEAYPVSQDEINQLQYDVLFGNDSQTFLSMHAQEWEVPKSISPNFTLTKRQQFFQDISDTDTFNLIYFDAFGARVQPDLWTESIFSKMYQALKPQGVLVTYSAKGSVRRAMQAVGFEVERLPGPPGKREMLRARKSS